MWYLLACLQNELRPLSPESTGDGTSILSVEPENLNFGTLAPGEQAVRQIRLQNQGDAAFSINTIRISDPRFSASLPTAELEPDEIVTVDLLYSADGQPHSAEAAIWSDADQNPTASVMLTADVRSSVLTILPENLDFGLAYGRMEKAFVLRNDGFEPLTVSDWRMEGPGFSVEGAALPLSLNPGETTEVTVFYDGQTDRAEGLFWVESDALESNLPGTVEGQVATPPVAVCEAGPNPVAAIFEDIHFSGSSSFDPDGNPLVTYSWTLLSQPTGSSAHFDAHPGESFDFRPDLAGSYVAQLVVTNAAGIPSAPCEVSVEAVVTADLWVEMYWALGADDMDLHLVESAGPIFSPQDCFFGNCTFANALDWGQLAFPADNPHLDLDDVLNVGPENINIAAPAPGSYTVWVHDYPGTEMDRPNPVTVTIYVGGQKAWSETRLLSGEDVREPFATVAWPSGTITPL